MTDPNQYGPQVPPQYGQSMPQQNQYGQSGQSQQGNAYGSYQQPQQGAPQYGAPQYGAPQGQPAPQGSNFFALTAPLDQPAYNCTMGESFIRFWKKYAVFKGRASRGEFWWWVLCNIIIVFAISLLFGLLGAIAGHSASYATLRISRVVTGLWSLATLVPNLALSVRRMHDTNKSGWSVAVCYGVLLVGYILTIAGTTMTGIGAVNAIYSGDTSTAATGAILTIIGSLVLIAGCIVYIVFMARRSDPAGVRFDDPSTAGYAPTAPAMQNYATLTRSETLLPLVGDKAKLQHYAATTPIVDMVRFSPAQLDAEALINLLRPLTPRLYSIASSQAEVENEVHVTVGVVRYDVEGRARAGGASSFLADRVEEEGEVRIFIEHNDNFRLPANPETPVIMIGPGTGIAPFRAFMQQRAADEAPGKNWLFFGNPHFTEDFLYQVEWQRYVKEGVLTRIDLAWSRDQKEKIYVQDKLREQGAELWRWINDGAHIYVCGDANRMAKDVEQALLEVIAEFGGMDTEAADEFLSELRVERRYQRDVY